MKTFLQNANGLIAQEHALTNQTDTIFSEYEKSLERLSRLRAEIARRASER